MHSSSFTEVDPGQFGHSKVFSPFLKNHIFFDIIIPRCTASSWLASTRAFHVGLITPLETGRSSNSFPPAQNFTAPQRLAKPTRSATLAIYCPC